MKKRPQWEAAKAAAHRGEYKVLVIAAIDRLGRSMGGNLNEILTLDRAGVEVVSVREPWLDMAGPVRELLIAIFSWVAAEERRVTGIRCKQGQDRARRQGKHCGRPPTVLDLDRVRQLREEGLSIRAIAEKLGVPESVIHRSLKSTTNKGPQASASGTPSTPISTPPKARQIAASMSP